MVKLSLFVVAIVIVAELIWLFGINGYVDRYLASIEATELWYGPAPGEPADDACADNKAPPGPGALPDSRKIGSDDECRTAF